MRRPRAVRPEKRGVAVRTVAFDVETPNRRNDAICSIGLCVFEDGCAKQACHYLVDPEADFDAMNVGVHGIRPEDVAHAPTFEELWPLIGPVLHSGIAVAHNAAFDLGVLRKLFFRYGIAEPPLTYVCTCRMTRKLLPSLPDHRLPTLCRAYGIPLDHHDAGSDSRACGEILQRLLERGAPLDPFLREYRFGPDGGAEKRRRY
ncbi:MAG: 3'-5' exonuclease [Oscillospiraceae bacterium]|nr:3'-5' exonuclease [Oscillospiraceae bacterium]